MTNTLRPIATPKSAATTHRFLPRSAPLSLTLSLTLSLALCVLLGSLHTPARADTLASHAAPLPALKVNQTLTLNPELLESAMQALLKATILRDLEGTLKFVAPKKIQKISQAMGKSHQDTIAALVQMGRELDQRNGVKVLTGHYDLDAAQYGTTSTGRSYALLPYSRTFQKDGRVFENTHPTLASVDGGHIFITPLSDEKLLPELISLYPDLADIPIPAEGVKP